MFLGRWYIGSTPHSHCGEGGSIPPRSTHFARGPFGIDSARVKVMHTIPPRSTHFARGPFGIDSARVKVMHTIPPRSTTFYTSLDKQRSIEIEFGQAKKRYIEVYLK